MTRGVRLYLVGSFVLVSLAGCGRGFFSEEREAWRTEAEIACLKSGAVKESTELVRISPISGPGVCGAEFPLKVGALGETSGTFGFADEDLRPPAPIGNQPRWPISEPPLQYKPQPQYYPDAGPRGPGYGVPSSGPISLRAPGVGPDDDATDLPGAPQWRNPPPQAPYPQTHSPRDRYAMPYPERATAPVLPGGDRYRSPRLGRGPDHSVTAFGPVALRPAATLACPIVSALDRWITDSVQPASLRWFGTRVVEIRQISAYSCRGRNGDGTSRISEHAFGNALDIAAFMLADGRRINLETAWYGLPEEQGFLRDVQASACHHFTTVLAPGSNTAHYNHIHVDLRKRSGRDICSPQAVSGEEIAARVGARLAARHPEEPAFTSSAGQLRSSREARKATDDDDDD
jgi:Extensin-like protein C-terminus